ncbi:hypothetical protein EAL2_808p01160 (plasmid) [Peptoclostridium acidaminophilum DSM 3953]|uniref:Uncharacterized protein n=1 Tax=Peptoclostridium acidaminophilum DSM 3953 TaxID=1286171 RepID=W8TN90_PEPAC|nr:hypothetical protein [Peptoclostridium acidaminophilum]AHM57622.1 hypothetical protein EAL2_808p01160 [Peptoclostridium acidaminophilum DSM 3953]
MGPKFIRLNSSTRHERHTVIAHAREAISKSGGWILDFKMFSNVSINIVFQMALGDVGKLEHALEQVEIKLYPESIDALEGFVQIANELPRKKLENEIFGTLQITFIHSEKDLKIIVPSVPG